MIFKISGDQGTVWYYDNTINQIYDNCFQVIDLTLYDSVKSITFNGDYNRYYSNNNFKINSKYPIQYQKSKHIAIQFGFACNYKCSYCSQNINTKSTDKIDLKLFFDKLQKSKIIWKNISVIELYGGEPLVYWKTLTQVVLWIENNTDFRGKFSIVTNGSLFSPKVYDFCDSHNFGITFSHDGVNQTRFRHNIDWLYDLNIQPLAKKWIEKHDSRKSCVILLYTPYGNLNLWDSIKLINERLGNVSIMFTSGMRCDESSKHLLAQYSIKNERIATDNMYNVSLRALRDNDSQFVSNLAFAREYGLHNIRHFVFNRLPVSYNARCPKIGNYDICFNLKGELLPCEMGSPGYYSYGTVDDIDNCGYQNCSSIIPNECVKCPYIQICGGTCPILSNTGKITYCRSSLWRSRAHFEVAWTYIFNERPVKIEHV